MPRFVLLTALTLLCSLSSEAAAQRLKPQSTAERDAAPTLTISGKVGGKNHQASGPGSCRHAPEASIRGVSASLWMVQFSGGDGSGVKQLNLTLWRPKDGGPDQVSLTFDAKSGSHRVETGSTAENQGEATVVILPNGPGGRLEISGKDGDGKPMQVTIDCPAFAGVEAEGG
jgi:hypothetical protein